MSKKVNVYSAETALGTLEVRGKQLFVPKNKGDIPDPLVIAYNMEFLLNGEKFAECGIYQITKDKKQGFTDVQGDSEEVLLYCDGQDEDLGEIAYQLFHNSVDRPDLPIDTFMLLSDLTFVSAKPELAMECIKGIFHNSTISAQSTRLGMLHTLKKKKRLRSTSSKLLVFRSSTATSRCVSRKTMSSPSTIARHSRIRIRSMQ